MRAMTGVVLMALIVGMMRVRVFFQTAIRIYWDRCVYGISIGRFLNHWKPFSPTSHRLLCQYWTQVSAPCPVSWGWCLLGDVSPPNIEALPNSMGSCGGGRGVSSSEVLFLGCGLIWVGNSFAVDLVEAGSVELAGGVSIRNEGGPIVIDGSWRLEWHLVPLHARIPHFEY